MPVLPKEEILYVHANCVSSRSGIHLWGSFAMILTKTYQTTENKMWNTEYFLTWTERTFDNFDPLPLPRKNDFLISGEKTIRECCKFHNGDKDFFKALPVCFGPKRPKGSADGSFGSYMSNILGTCVWGKEKKIIFT